MIVAILLALLPVAFVIAMATGELRPWRRTLEVHPRAPREHAARAPQHQPEVTR